MASSRASRLFLSPSYKASPARALRPFCSGQNKQHEAPLPASLRQKFQTFEERPAHVIRDWHEETYGMRWEEKHRDVVEDESFYLYREKKKPQRRAEALDARRGVHGVFDIEDLVDALRSEKMEDLSVVAVTPEAHYCEYLVLVTAKSQRHMEAVVQFIRKLYKLKMRAGDPQLPETVGLKGKSSWRVIDMGYIVIHFFMPGVREVYDLESLWCVGPEFDEKTVRPQFDEIVDFMEKHVKFIEQLSPQTDPLVPASGS